MDTGGEGQADKDIWRPAGEESVPLLSPLGHRTLGWPHGSPGDWLLGQHTASLGGHVGAALSVVK